jgi:hypothetical protein
MSLKFSTLSRHLLLFLAVVPFLSQPAMAQTKKVAFFPLAFNGDASKSYLRQGLRTMIISRLSDKEIEMVGEETIRSLMEGEDNKESVSPGRAGELAKRIGADYALFGSVTALGQTYRSGHPGPEASASRTEMDIGHGCRGPVVCQSGGIGQSLKGDDERHGHDGRQGTAKACRHGCP